MIYVALFAGLLLGWGASRLIFKMSRKRPYLANIEYWIYLPGKELPPQEKVMRRMLGDNPYGRPGDPPIGHKEGMLFSDVRLHIALVLRSKNPHAFRPDLLSEGIEPDAQQLQRLEEAHSLAKIRYVSESPLPDKRHIAFAIHAADAMADLGNGKLIYDCAAERLFDKEEIEQSLTDDPSGLSADLHLKIVWTDNLSGGSAETRGLKKIGVEDLATAAMESDERVLVTQVLDEAACAIWQKGALEPTLEVDAFDDKFRLQTLLFRNGKMLVRILRVQAA